MTFEEIERLVRRLEGSDITALTVTDDTSSLTLRLAPGLAERAAGTPTVDASPPTPPATPTLRAKAIGLLRLRHPEAANAPVFPRAVMEGDIVAFLQAGPLLLPVVAEADGSIGEPLVADGGLVGYGTPLFPLP